ncbi:MAG: hypothetical protein K9L68_15015 [Spirochaetales bacterium]|nr:hypothetical protein [Spirochaetales bacterium]
MEEVRLLVAAALEIPIDQIVVVKSWILSAITAASAVVATVASIYGQMQANEAAQDQADKQEAIAKARAAANRKNAKFQYQQAQDQAEIAREDVEFTFEQGQDAFAMGMGANAAGYRQATQEIDLQREQAIESFRESMESVENARNQAIEEVKYKVVQGQAQLAAMGGRGGSTRNRLKENIARATGNIVFQTENNIEGIEFQRDVTEQKLDWAGSRAIRKKRSGIVQTNEQMQQVEKQYHKMMGGDGYGQGTIAERLESAKNQRDRVVGADDYAASAMSIDDYSGGFGTSDFMTATANLQKQSVYDQTGFWSIFNAGTQGASTGFSIGRSLYQIGKDIGGG